MSGINIRRGKSRIGKKVDYEKKYINIEGNKFNITIVCKIT